MLVRLRSGRRTQVLDLEDATRATIAFSQQHDTLVRAVDASAAQRGVFADHDDDTVEHHHVVAHADVEHHEAHAIAARTNDHHNARSQLCALWRQKHWARSLPRLGLAHKDAHEAVLKRQPRVATVDDVLPPHMVAPSPSRRPLPELPQNAASSLRQQLHRSGKFIEATHALVRRDMEKTLSMSAKAAARGRGPTAFSAPLASPLKAKGSVVSEEDHTALEMECARWGAKKMAKVLRAMAFRIQLRGLHAWAKHAQYSRRADIP